MLASDGWRRLTTRFSDDFEVCFPRFRQVDLNVLTWSQRNGTTYFEGEYSCQTDRNGDRWAYPSVLCKSLSLSRCSTPKPTHLLCIPAAISEGAYMTGLERNSDIVFAAAYAPVLNHVNATDWVCVDPFAQLHVLTKLADPELDRI